MVVAKDNAGTMSLVDHLAELRRRLIVIAVVNLVVTFVLLQFSEQIMVYILALNPGMQLVYINPQELFLVYLQTALIIALVLCSPVTIYQVWSFVSKGLFKKERIYGAIALVLGVFFFGLGVYFSYIVVLPITLGFFVRITIGDIAPMISIQSFSSFANTMLASCGLVFEMPVLAFLFTKLGVISSRALRKKQGVLILIIFIFAAIITPPDVVSQILLGVPMVLLLQLSILISALVERKEKKKDK